MSLMQPTAKERKRLHRNYLAWVQINKWLRSDSCLSEEELAEIKHELQEKQETQPQLWSPDSAMD